MVRRVGALLAASMMSAFVACSAELVGDASDDPPDGGAGDGMGPSEGGAGDVDVDGGGDGATPSRCTPRSPIDKTMVLDLGSEELTDDRHPTLNDAETELFFASTRRAQRYPTIYRALRAAPTAPFVAPTSALPILASGTLISDSHGSVSGDGLSLVFSTKRETSISFDIWIARRPGLGVPFDSVDPVTTGVNDPSLDENSPTVDSAGVLWFARTVPSGDGGARQVIFTAQPKVGSPSWEKVVEMTALNHPDLSTGKPVLSADRLTLYFATNRDHPGALGDYDIWSATRTSTSEAFGNLAPVADLATPLSEVPGWLSPDGCRLYFDRVTPKGTRIFAVVRKP